MEGLVAELLEGARAEMAVVAEHGGAVEAVPYMKAALVDSHRRRIQRIESGEQVVVGQNRFTETEVSPLTADAEGGILVVDPAVEAEQIESVRRWRAERDQQAVDDALAELARVAASEDAKENLMVPTIAAARAGVTTGEWAKTLREVFGSYRAPTGVGEASAAAADEELSSLREQVAGLTERLGRRPKILVGKPGLDGHSNGAEQIAVRARDAGMDVVYEGIRLTPAQIAASALQEGVHVIGLSILSGSHLELIPAVIDALREAGVNAPVVVGGIIPEQDVAPLKQAGVAAVYTPKDFDITRIVRDILAMLAEEAERTPVAVADGAARAGLERGAPGAEPAREHRPGRPRGGRRAAGRDLPRGARRRGPGPRRRRDRAARGGEVDAALGADLRLAGPRADRRPARGRPELAPLGRLAARGPRADRVRPRRPRRADPLDGRGRAARRPRPADA